MAFICLCSEFLVQRLVIDVSLRSEQYLLTSSRKIHGKQYIVGLRSDDDNEDTQEISCLER
jgi:hypothetical protein